MTVARGSSQAAECPDMDSRHLGRDQIAQRIGGIVTPDAVFIDVRLEHIARPFRIVLQ